MRGRGRRSRRQCSGRALLGCDRRRDFRPSARASCPTSWHSHTHTPHANNMCSALLRAHSRAQPQPARHTHNNNSDFIYGPVCPNTQESALSFFLRAPPKLSSAPKNCSARVIVAERCGVCGGWVGDERRILHSVLSCISADERCRPCINHRLSPFPQSTSPLPGYIKVIRPQSVEAPFANKIMALWIYGRAFFGAFAINLAVQRPVCASDSCIDFKLLISTTQEIFLKLLKDAKFFWKHICMAFTHQNCHKKNIWWWNANDYT